MDTAKAAQSSADPMPSQANPRPVAVIICTHNPRAAHFSRVLAALELQSLPNDQWDLLVIDNHSTPALSETTVPVKHLRLRLIREEKVGLTAARLRGIAESDSNLLVFVDDDNVLDPDYLVTALAIGRDHANLGAWGGSVRGAYDTPPPDWFRPYLGWLAVNELNRDWWSNSPTGNGPAFPFGAGLCVRRKVAALWAQQVESNPLRQALGRSGVGMAAGEDTDLVHCALDLGMGTGRFQSLRLTHLVPAERLTQQYLFRLVDGSAFSNEILASLRPSHQGGTAAPRSLWLARATFALEFLFASRIQKRIMLIQRRATRRARRLLQT